MEHDILQSELDALKRHAPPLSDARVERVRNAFKVAWDTMEHVDINIDRDKIWFAKHPTMIEAMFGLGDAIKALAAADAVPVAAGEWTGEPPTDVGNWHWTRCTGVLVPTRVNGGELQTDCIEWWSVPISEPPKEGR
jgi:hypothetical protein